MPNSHRHTRHDKTVLSVSCLVCRYGLDDCSERVRTSDFPSVTVLSCRESSSHRRSGRDADKTVLSCLAWRCELAFIGRATGSGTGGEVRGGEMSFNRDAPLRNNVVLRELTSDRCPLVTVSLAADTQSDSSRRVCRMLVSR